MTNQDWIKGFRDKFRHCSCELWLSSIKPLEVEAFIETELQSVRTETLKEAKEIVEKIKSEWANPYGVFHPDFSRGEKEQERTNEVLDEVAKQLEDKLND